MTAHKLGPALPDSPRLSPTLPPSPVPRPPRMSDQSQPILQSCPGCGTNIDVTDEEPFAQMHCPSCGAGMRVRRNFDHFELQEILGVGGMGSVYRAQDINLNRMVALKLLNKEYSADPQFVKQFQTEAAVTASVNHPHVVKVYSSGTDHSLLYIAMELVDKGSLDELMTVQGRINEAQALDVGIQIAQGLNAALKSGLIHRDIKPSNILFYDAKTAKIVDFGLAALMDEAGKVGGEVWGTPYYVAPEKLDGRPEDARSDIYSLGATLFHALAGRPPFEAETASMTTLKHLKSQPVSIQSYAPDLSSATAYVINKSLSKEPQDRYQTYEALIEHLEYARDELEAKVAKKELKKEPPVEDSEKKQLSTAWLTYGMVAAVVLVGILVYSFYQTGSDEARGSSHPHFGTSSKVDNSVEARFKAAREQLFSGQYSAAAEALDQIDAEPNIPQPLHNWVTLYCGLAQLLGTQNAKADATFDRLKERGQFSSDASEAKLSNFFIDLAIPLQSPNPIPAAARKKIDPTSYQAVALLLFALKDWNIEKFDDAEPLFRDFIRATPEAPALWIGDQKDQTRLKDIAAKHLAEYSDYHAALSALKSAVTPEKKQAALERAKTLRATMKPNSKLVAHLDKVAEEIQPAVAAWIEEKRKKAAALAASVAAADSKALSEAKQQRNTFSAQYRFIEARQALQAPKLKEEKARSEQESLIKKTDYLVQFKATLIRDLNAGTYAAPVQRRNGVTVPGGVSSADEQGIKVRIPFGFVAVSWSDLSINSIYSMAQSFIRPGQPLSSVAEHKWLLGAFACFTGKTAEGHTLLTEAAQARPEYTAALPVFLEFVETP